MLTARCESDLVALMQAARHTAAAHLCAPEPKPEPRAPVPIDLSQASKQSVEAELQAAKVECYHRQLSEQSMAVECEAARQSECHGVLTRTPKLSCQLQ